MISWENLLFVREIYIFGGLEQMTPVHATAHAFGSSAVPEDTSATGSGDMYIPGFISRLGKMESPSLKVDLNPIITKRKMRSAI